MDRLVKPHADYVRLIYRAECTLEGGHPRTNSLMESPSIDPHHNPGVG